MNQRRELSHQAHRQLIGWLGILFAPMLFLLAGLRTTLGLANWEMLSSISSYYYTGAVAAFAGMLFALALFLLTYSGYNKVDRVVGIMGGISALGVAFFPTGAPSNVAEPLWWSPIIRNIHYVSATVLFGSFIIFSLWLFRKTAQDTPVSKSKRMRNRIYLGCGLVMVACVLWTGSSFFTGASIFWPETLALSAFSVSWLVKGYAHRLIVNLGRRILVAMV